MSFIFSLLNMTLFEITALLAFLFPLAFSPGPGNLFFAANGARFGFRSTLASNFGYHLATWSVTLALGLGFAASMNQFPNAFIVIKVVGSLYVLWLAWKLFQAGSVDISVEAKPAGFWDGIVLLLLNPKAYFIITVMFSQFLTTTADQALLTVIWITTIFTLNNFIAFSLWTKAGDYLARHFRNKDNARYLNRIFGSVLGMVGIWMLLT